MDALRREARTAAVSGILHVVEVDTCRADRQDGEANGAEWTRPNDDPGKSCAPAALTDPDRPVVATRQDMAMNPARSVHTLVHRTVIAQRGILRRSALPSMV